MKILITGSNRGLGYHLTEWGLKRGHEIFAGVRNPNTGLKALGHLQETYKKRLTSLQLEVTDEESVRTAAEHIKARSARLDAVINNAGILVDRDKTIKELDLDACLKSFDVNTPGPIRVIKHCLPLLEKGEKPSIINISSEAGSLTHAGSVDYPYGLSKVALNMLSEKLNIYLKNKDFQVYAVHPSWMKTDMGGDKAPINPTDTARGIYEIIEHKVTVNSRYVFIDYKGNRMAI